MQLQNVLDISFLFQIISVVVQHFNSTLNRKSFASLNAERDC